MPQKKSTKIQHHFANLTDPRRRKVTYPLINIVVIAICAVVCGADDFVAIADFGKTKRMVRALPRPQERHPVTRPFQRDSGRDQASKV